MSLRRHALYDCVNFMNLAFSIKCHFNVVFNFIVLLSYRAIHVFLLQGFSYPIATHGHEPSYHLKKWNNFLKKNSTCERKTVPRIVLKKVFLT